MRPWVGANKTVDDYIGCGRFLMFGNKKRGERRIVVQVLLMTSSSRLKIEQLYSCIGRRGGFLDIFKAGAP